MKIAIIGSGNIGSALASMLVFGGSCEKVALVDIFEDFARGRAEDILTMAQILNSKTEIFATSNYEDLKGFDYFVVTAGMTRKEGQTREELLNINAKIIKDIAQNISKANPNPIIITITNPVDVLTNVMCKAGNFDKNRVVGMAGELDSARAALEYKRACKKYNITPTKAPIVLGLHNDNMIFYYPDDSLNKSQKEELEQTVKGAGALITKLTRTSAYFSPAAAAFKMIQAFENGSEVIACVFNDELTFGRRVKLGKKGIEKILEEKVDFSETKEKFNNVFKDLKI